MTLTAVVLAGFPEEPFRASLKALEQRYPDGYVFRGRATKFLGYHDAKYDDNDINNILDQASDAVFGCSRRPVSFCGHLERPCKDVAPAGKTCGKSDKQTCRLKAPNRLVLVYQDADRVEHLLGRFYHAALSVGIPRSVYGKPKDSAKACMEGLDRALSLIAEIDEKWALGSYAALLPPKAFGQSRAVKKMLRSVNDKGQYARAVRKFRQEYYRSVFNGFEARNDLKFKRSEWDERHGFGQDAKKIELKLPSEFRLGCSFGTTRLHWDVSRQDENRFDGSHSFDCREYGKVQPTGKTHVNIWPEDWIGP